MPQGEDPRAVVWAATRAVEQDDVKRIETRWRSRVARQPNDRAALLGLATLARLQYDYPAAESTYRALIAGPADRVSVYAHLGLAQGFEARSFSSDARPAYLRARAAARDLGDPIAEAEALVLMATVRRQLEGLPVGQALLDTATRLIPDTSFALRSRLENRNAIVHAVSGRAAQASEAANAGIALARRAGDLRAEAEGWRVLGQVLQYRGQWDSALTALEQAEDRYLRARSRGELASALVWWAQVLGSQARFGEMRQVIRRMLAEGEATRNPDAVSDGHRAFGVADAMLGNWPGAAAHFRQSDSISAAIGDSSGARTTAKYLALVALTAGDVATARRIHQRRLAQARRSQDALERYDAARDLAGIAQREGDSAAAAEAIAEARSQLRLLPGTSYPIWLLHDEARHAMARGNLALAERLLDSVVRSSRDGSAVIRFDGRVRLADIHARQGAVARAEQELAGATDEMERWRAGLNDVELRKLAFQAVTTIGASASDPTAIESSAARALAAIAGSGRTEAAFSLAERWRARVLMDLVNRAAALRAEQPTTGPSGARTGAVPRSAREVVAALPDRQTALLEYVVAPHAPLTVFIVQKSGIQSLVLPQLDSLGPMVARYRTLLEDGADPARLARSLGAVLLDPVLSRLEPGITRILIAPDGPLHRLAFDALRLADGRYLVERYAIGLVPSGSVAAALWARRREPAAELPLRLLALGDPRTDDVLRVSEPGAGSEDFLAAARAAGGLPRLRGSAQEARMVARYAPTADVRLGREASAEFLKQADLRPYRVLHFATHAIVDERSIAGTALVLSPGRNQSGFVGAGDLAVLRIDADLVVLSSCTSAGGTLTGGEGVQGLSSALLEAGTRALVATAWRINDREVVPLVDAFYAGLAKQQPVIEALRAAKLQALRRGAPPRTWAGFMALGDPLVVVPLRPPRRSWWSSLIGR
jgi:CHAT domain-containing protein/tetratricopeptide (TPR) repeat protein